MFKEKMYCIYPYNAPSLLIAPPPPPSSQPLQSLYCRVLHPSQQPPALRFQDSEKRYFLVIPQSNTAYKK